MRGTKSAFLVAPITVLLSQENGEAGANET